MSCPTIETIVSPQTHKEYRVERLLGKGSFGCTYEARESGGKRVAIKVLNLKLIRHRGMDIGAVKEEVENLQRLSLEGKCNRYVSCYYDSFTVEVNKELSLVIVMEYLSGTTLYEYITKKTNNTYFERWGYSVQLIEGLQYIHSRGVAHQDIKPENIIIDTETKRLKYIDFGLSCYEKNNENARKCQNGAGTYFYFPPESFLLKREVVQSFRIREMHDVWSLGVVLYQMWNKRTPFMYSNNIDKYTIEVIKMNYIPSKGNGGLIDALLNDKFIVGGVKGLKRSNIIKSSYDVSYLFREPFRATVSEILESINKEEVVCMVNGKNLDRNGLISLLKKLNVQYTIEESKEELCRKIKGAVESCSINNKLFNREELVVLSKLLGVNYNQTSSNMCEDIRKKIDNIHLQLRHKVLEVLESTARAAALAKVQGKEEEKNSLLNNVVLALSIALEVSEKLIDYGALLCKYRELRVEYIRYTQSKDSYNAEIKRNEANYIVLILKTVMGDEIFVNTDEMLIGENAELVY